MSISVIYSNEPVTPKIDQAKTAAAAEQHFIQSGLAMCEISDAMTVPNRPSMGMLYKLVKGDRSWTKPVFDNFIETIDRLTTEQKTKTISARR